MHAELANFVAGGGYDTAAARAPDDDGAAFQTGIVTLLDGCVEGIHVHMKNRAIRRFRHDARFPWSSAFAGGLTSP
jgi:hypothetical protein